MTARRSLTAAFALATLAACGGGSTGPQGGSVATVAVAPAGETVLAGASVTLTATLRDAAGNPVTGKPIAWSTSNAAVATVAGGVVTGVSAGGPVTITATSEGKSGTATVTVAAVPVASVEVTPPTATLEVGGTRQLAAVARSATGQELTGRTIAWSSEDGGVASVSAAGLVTAVGPGTTSVTATSEGRTASASITVNPPPLAVQSITLGGYFSCALMNNGAAYCWGVNFNGQLGDGTATHKFQATAVLGGHRFKALFAGLANTCGIDVNDVVRCWGSAMFGALGNGATADASLPAPITPVGEAVVQVAPATAAHSLCALTASARIFCWGRDPSMVLTGSTTVPQPTLLPVGTTPPMAEIALGGGSGCGRTAANEPWCWGLNFQGALGDGTTTLRPTPVRVVGGHTFTKVGVGSGFACGLKANGEIWCWGNNEYGQLGDGTFTNRTSPVRVVGASDFIELGVGAETVCALRAGGSPWCWGSNQVGVLGDGTTTARATPVAIGGGKTFTRLGVGVVHACGIATDGVYCWGGNGGQLGDGTQINRATPVKVLGLPVGPG